MVIVRIYVKFRAGKLFWDPSIAPLAADLQLLEGKRSLGRNYASLELVKMLGKSKQISQMVVKIGVLYH